MKLSLPGLLLSLALIAGINPLTSRANSPCLKAELHKIQCEQNPLLALARPELYEARQAKFEDGREYLSLHIRPSVEADPAYQAFLKNSVEVIFFPIGRYGHTSLRVGDRYYSLSAVKDFSSREYSPRLKKGVQGAAFLLPPEKILQAQEKIETLAKSSRETNLPPYDVGSPLVEVIQEKDGSLRFKSPTWASIYGKNLVNNAPVDAKLIMAPGKTLLRSATGFEYPVLQVGKKLKVRSLSCVTSTAQFMNELLGLDVVLNFDQTAKSFARGLFKGNPKHSAPDVILSYEP